LILDGDNISEAIDVFDNLAIEFYTTSCGHCIKLEPIWKRLAFRVNNDLPNLTLARINCEENPEVVQTFKLTGYPAIRLYSGSKKEREYEG